MNGRILIVDDEEGLREALAEKLRHAGHTVESVDSAESALSRLTAFGPQLILTDLRMPGLSGLELTEKVREGMPGVEVVVMTGHEDMTSAVAAMKAGAFDYLVKPVRLREVEALVERCLEEQALNQADADAEKEADPRDPPGPDAIIGRDPRMIDIFKLIGTLARNRATVLVRGETGTGKEKIARAIHENSMSAGEPFIAVNCTALTDTLLESELFGHVKGAFTGAAGSRKGYFELAGRGTIFLDELGDTSAEFQTKLLRVLQERTFYPVGGEQPRETHARVVAATHQPLEALVKEGSFREDLYFRLRVVEITVPPLKDRRGDIALLAEALLGRIRDSTGTTVDHIAPEAMELLDQHDWPGNVRELENALTRAALVARGRTITADHLHLGQEGESAARKSGEPMGKDSLDAVIASHLTAILNKADGNRSEAARMLEISRSRLQRLVAQLGIEAAAE